MLPRRLFFCGLSKNNFNFARGGGGFGRSSAAATLPLRGWGRLALVGAAATSGCPSVACRTESYPKNNTKIAHFCPPGEGILPEKIPSWRGRWGCDRIPVLQAACIPRQHCSWGRGVTQPPPAVSVIFFLRPGRGPLRRGQPRGGGRPHNMGSANSWS